MSQPEILQNVDMVKLRNWLSIIVIPWIVKPSFFMQMGFSELFVRLYFKKHKDATKLNGEKIKKVRGVSEMDFLNGLAEAIEADCSKGDAKLCKSNQVDAWRDACIARLDEIEREETEELTDDIKSK